MQNERLLRLPEVAEIVGLARPTIYRYTKDGKFPRPVKVGSRNIRWRWSDVLKWMESREVGGPRPWREG